MMPHLRLIITCLLSTISAFCLPARAQVAGDTQVEPPAKLEEFRQAFEKALATRTAPTNQEFITALEALVRERSESGEYEGAILARDRRKLALEFTNQSSTTPVDDTSREGEIVIDIKSGSRSGSGLKFDAKTEKMIGFSKAKQNVTWDLSKTLPGVYNAIVTYSCGDPITDNGGETTATGGSFTLQEATGLSTVGSAPLQRIVVSTGGWDKPITRNIGKVKITGSRLSLLLTVTKSEAAGLMHLYGIKLVPDSTDGPKVGLDGTAQTELEALRQKFLAAVSTRTTPAIMSYGNALRSLRDAMSDAAKLDEARIVQEEFDTAKALNSDPSLIYAPPESSVTRTSKDVEIEALEATYRSGLKSVRQDLGEKWLDALSNLKDELTRSQKFSEALLVRDEEERVKGLLESAPIPTAETQVTETLRLDTRLATLDGESELRKDDNSIEFPKVGSSATWELPADLTPGTYELILRFRSGKSGGGNYQVEIGGDQILKGTIAPTPDDDGGWKKRRMALVGECIFDQLTGSLKISVLEISGDRAIMSLDSIALAPQGTWIEMQSSDDPLATDENEVAPDRGRNFEKLEGVKWVDKDDRKSGEITVRHSDKEHTFRLYFVQLPPAEMPENRSGQANLSRAARQLRTTEDRIIRLGKKVDSSLRDELWTESLTVYTRWETRGRDGSPYAFVLVGDTPLSQTLVEKGYARTGGSFASEAPFIAEKRSAKNFMTQLRAAEKEAKQARRGIWGL